MNQGRYQEAKFDLELIPNKYYRVYDYYQLSFNENGVPGKLENGEWVEHPMYGSYLIRDYIYSFKTSHNPNFLESAEKIAHLVIGRCESIDNALVYFYDQEKVSTLFEGKYYSGLTQSNYVTQFIELYEVTSNKFYLHIALKFANSLMIAVKDGGVYYNDGENHHIEEYPSEPVLWTLNGWVTAVQNLHRLYLLSQDKTLEYFLINNVKTIEKLLPLYDCEEVLNSRYQLSGFCYIRVLVKKGTLNISKIGMNIGSDKYDISKIEPLGKPKGRWNFGFVRGNGVNRVDNCLSISKMAIFNVIVTMGQENILNIEHLSGIDSSFEIQIAQGGYSPNLTAMPTEKWVTLATFDVDNQEEIELKIDSNFLNQIAYPTNFKKCIGGKNYNAYHFIHIEKLREINEWFNSEIIELYINKWLSYVENWPKNDLYLKNNVEFHKYGSKPVGI